MKKILILIAILVFWGCEEESDGSNIVGYTPSASELDPTNWEGTDNLDVDNSWQFNFWNYNGNLMWRFMDTCENSCGGSPYTLNTDVTPNEIDLVVNIGCMEESYEGLTAKGIIDIQKETLNGTISFTGLTIAISAPGSDSRPTSFDDAYRVWDLDYLDIDDPFYVDDFFVVDCDEDGELSDEAECGGENDSDVGVCAPPIGSGCDGDPPLYDPTGYRVYNTSQVIYDSETECSGSTDTTDLSVSFGSFYWEYFPGDSIYTNTALFGNEYKYCVSGSSLYIYYFTEILGTLTEVAYGTYTMTSDSTYHKLSEPYCTCGPNYTSDTCNEECQNSNPWRHCTIYHYGPDPED